MAQNLNFQRTKALLDFTIHTERHQFYLDQGIMENHVSGNGNNPINPLLSTWREPEAPYEKSS